MPNSIFTFFGNLVILAIITKEDSFQNSESILKKIEEEDNLRDQTDLKKGQNINYKRKSFSKMDLSDQTDLEKGQNINYTRKSFSRMDVSNQI